MFKNVNIYNIIGWYAEMTRLLTLHITKPYHFCIITISLKIQYVLLKQHFCRQYGQKRRHCSSGRLVVLCNLDGHYGMSVVWVLSPTPHFTPSIITLSNTIQAHCQYGALRCDI